MIIPKPSIIKNIVRNKIVNALFVIRGGPLPRCGGNAMIIDAER